MAQRFTFYNKNWLNFFFFLYLNLVRRMKIKTCCWFWWYLFCFKRYTIDVDSCERVNGVRFIKNGRCGQHMLCVCVCVCVCGVCACGRGLCHVWITGILKFCKGLKGWWFRWRFSFNQLMFLLSFFVLFLVFLVWFFSSIHKLKLLIALFSVQHPWQYNMYSIHIPA